MNALDRDMKGPEVPELLEHLANMSKESVYLWFKPGSGEPWRVWTGQPGGSEWASGSTSWEALEYAFRRMADAIFNGRMKTGG